MRRVERETRATYASPRPSTNLDKPKGNKHGIQIRLEREVQRKEVKMARQTLKALREAAADADALEAAGLKRKVKSSWSLIQ